ncbi:phage portal protein [Nocardiopsis alba]|uniref:phage portal protein n=1 Tax=Nocardiopsis alba TaxID=53437 RepID=UPI003D74B205
MDSAAALSVGLAQRARHKDAVDRVRRYMRGEHDRSYMPKSHEREFASLVQRAVGNWLPLVVDAIAQNLFVEGYRRAEDPDNLTGWRHWTANGMDSKQGLVHRAALTYGESYVTVMPGDKGPVIRAYSPLVMTVVQDDPDAEWPDYGVRRVRRDRTALGVDGTLWEVIDSEGIWSYLVPDGADDVKDYEIRDVWAHGFDVCPIAVFRNKWNDDPDSCFVEDGEVSPLIPLQDRLNDTTLGLLIAQQYSAFRQKWATGIEIPVDPVTKKPVESFESAVHRMWATSNKDVKFGEFGQTDLGGYLESQDSAIKHMSAIAQVPPHYLLGGLVNISAEALAAAEAGLTRKAGERKTLFGEAWARVMRLAAWAAGDTAGAEDTDARVVWRDTEARSLAAAADALGKMRQMLEVPVESLWEMIPGVGPFQIRQWKKARAEDMADSAASVAAALLAGDDRSTTFGADGNAAEDEDGAEAA